jgi:hypothetical protein
MQEPYRILEPLSVDLQSTLLEIYNRCKTYIFHFDHKNTDTGGEFICDTIWPEFQKDVDWIIGNILPYYGIDLENVVEYDYDLSGHWNSDSDFNETHLFSPPWFPNSLNFTRYEAGVAKMCIHHDKTPHVDGKLNIPLLNTDSGHIYYIDVDEKFEYKKMHPCLHNPKYYHNVLGIEDLQEDRVFFSLPVKDVELLDQTKRVTEDDYRNRCKGTHS